MLRVIKMTIFEAIHIIESTIKSKNADGNNWYSLQLSSQPFEQEDGTFKEMYRADCLYMVSGVFKDNISEALVSLAEEIDRR